MAAGQFEGFSPKTFSFLRELAENNDRAWFATRKERYERDVLAPMHAFVEDVGAQLGRAKIPLRGDAKRAVFRIYRDVRFSPDKRPYKTHVSAYLSYDGSKNAPGGLYVHVQPGESFCAVAFYAVDRPLLQRWRADMAARPARFRSVVRALEKHALTLTGPEDTDDALVRMPRGFEAHAESDLAPYFRLRHFMVRQALTQRDVCSRDLVDRVVTLARGAKPLLEYGWSLE